MLILNIADIHFDHRVCNTAMDPDLPYRTALVSDVRARVRDLGPVDMILVGGDIAYHGQPEEYEAALAWLRELAKAAACPLEGRTFVVPGNHDVDRNITRTSASVRNVQAAIKNASDAWRERELLAQFQDPDTSRALFAPLAAYNDFAARFDCQLYPTERLSWVQEFPLDGDVTLRIHGLNSTLLSGVDGKDDGPRENLYLSPLQTVLDPQDGVVNVVLCHHPPDWLSDVDDVEDAIRSRAGVQFFGHRHRQRIQMDQGHVRFSAGAVNPDRHLPGWSPGYNLVALSVERDDGGAHLAVEAHLICWQQTTALFQAIESPAGGAVFLHRIPIRGRITRPLLPAAAAARQLVAERPPLREPEPVRAELEMSDDHTRNLVFRFWSLSSSQRREIATHFGLLEEGDMRLLEPERYRRALLRAKERNLLGAVAKEIEKREAR
jgi:predicted MPP superfamily phosphohydrolase